MSIAQKESGEDKVGPVPQGFREDEAGLVQQASMVHVGLRDHRDLKVLKEFRDHLDLKAIRALKDLWAILVNLSQRLLLCHLWYLWL